MNKSVARAEVHKNKNAGEVCEMIKTAVKAFSDGKRSYKDEIIFAAAGFVVYFLLYGVNENLGFGLALGAFAAFVMLRKGFLFQATAFILASIFGGNLVCAIAAAFAAAPFLAVVVLRSEKKETKRLLEGIILAVAQTLYVISAESVEAVAVRFLGIALSIAMAYCGEDTLDEVLSRGVKRLPKGVRAFEVYFFIGVLSGGLHMRDIFGAELSCVLLPFGILFAVRLLGCERCIMTAIAMGLGCALFSGEAEWLALYALLGAAVSASEKRGIQVLTSVIAIPLFFAAFAGLTENVLYVLLACLSSAAFLFVPSKTVNRIKNGIMSDERASVRHIVNRQRSELSGRLYELSEVFFAMQHSFKSMVRGVMPSDKAAMVIARDVCGRVCGNCEERTRCWRTMQGDTERDFLAMTEAALDKGRATVIDVSNALTARCGRINSLIAEVNSQVDGYKRYFTMTVSSDNGKNLIAEQMLGISLILRELSTDSRKNVIFDDKKEREVINGLNQRGILCREAVFYDDGRTLRAALVIDESDAKNPLLSKYVSDAVRQPLMIDKTEASENEGWRVAHFVPRPMYDVLFGFAAERKSGSDTSGDTHSFLKISGNRFLLALCDGMGSGREAEEASSRAVSLVENFYKAGFDNETVLSSVNRLLATDGGERFTAVDIALIDLKDGLADFIKIGSPVGMVKQGGLAEFIEGGSLPMGVLDEMRPVITKKALSAGDYIYLFSDGTEQAFGGRNELGRFIASLEVKSPQEQADTIMKRALELSPEPKDDMTVIVSELIAS